ncbi:hypothetical protein ACOMHN_048706 [Nucella lapillus]
MISDLQIQVDSLEQYSRRNNVRISGIPEPKGGSVQEDTDNIVQKLGEAIGVRVTSEMIDRSHRVGKRTGTSDRQIIVKFTSYRYSRLLMTSRKGLKNKTAASLGFTPKGFTPPPRPSSAAEAAATPVPKPGNRIYVNDDLTRVRAQLAARARRFKREKKAVDVHSTYLTTPLLLSGPAHLPKTLTSLRRSPPLTLTTKGKGDVNNTRQSDIPRQKSTASSIRRPFCWVCGA